MKIFETKVPINLKYLVAQLVSVIEYYFSQREKDYKQLLRLYSKEEIFDAISSIFISGKAVYAPTDGKNGKILRYLEYGGNGVKSYKLLSKASRIISRKVNGDDYVF